jgi:hypothetical protein
MQPGWQENGAEDGIRCASRYGEVSKRRPVQRRENAVVSPLMGLTLQEVGSKTKSAPDSSTAERVRLLDSRALSPVDSPAEGGGDR